MRQPGQSRLRWKTHEINFESLKSFIEGTTKRKKSFQNRDFNVSKSSNLYIIKFLSPAKVFQNRVFIVGEEYIIVK